MRVVSVSVHDIYSSAFYPAQFCFFVFILSPFSKRHTVSLAEKNLIALINKVSWDRQQLRGMMLHINSERKTDRHKGNNVKSG